MGLRRFFFGAIFAGIFIFTHASSYTKKGPYSFMKEAASASMVTHHDYIIIGGGTAGCPLAATLAEKSTVLVLERGGSPYSDPRITNPRNFVLNLADVSKKSPAQVFVSEDGVVNHRARVLGGGSSVNAGFYTRTDATYVERAGWDPRGVEEAYKWVEDVVAFRPEVMTWQAAVKDGLLEVGVGPDNGFSYAELDGSKVGGIIFDGNERRRTAADFLGLAHPGKIEVYLHATVQKILFRNNHEKSRVEAYGVSYKDKKGMLHTALLSDNSKSEVILSAGAIASPQLLMLSGIGPAHHLQAHGIDVVLDQPMVGKDIADNPMNPIIVPSPIPVGVTLAQVVGRTKFGCYFEGISGINLVPSLPHSLSKDFQSLLNQSSQPLFGVDRDEGPPEGDHTTIKIGVIVQKVEGPASTGHLELKDTNVDENPSVTFNYYKERVDLDKCMMGMKTLMDLVGSEALSKFKYKHVSVQDLMNLVAVAPVNLKPRHVNTSTNLEQYCIDTVMTQWHYHGGCQVDKVIDKEYKVIGIDALRVVDASTYRGSPGANPQATIMMLGRYVGRMIIDEKFGAHA